MDWDFVFSIIAAGTSIIALVFASIQITISNKQSLFDRRLDCYTKILGKSSFAYLELICYYVFWSPGR